MSSSGNILSESIVVRLAGDSGDGVQLMGTQFVAEMALAGIDFGTFPDYPAEIRAPTGTPYGVSAYQVHLGLDPITTAGDEPRILVAFNPAALKVNLPDVASGGLIILNSDSFTSRGLARAGYSADPRKTGELDSCQVVEVDLTRLAMEAVKGFGLSKSEAARCKNFWALGLVVWMFGRDVLSIDSWIRNRFVKQEGLRAANVAALHAGHAYGETMELAAAIPRIVTRQAAFPHGEYRGIRGSEALAFGLAAAGELADRPIVFCSYPITPASALMHNLVRLGHLAVGVFQAEDEIAAVCAALGASYGGAIGVTSSSGPGIVLKTEAIGLAISTELPLIVIDSQRAGPSTGMPTKTEQSDLYQAVYGRNADAPVPVIAPSTPGDCFEVAIEAVRIALRHMTPVIVLTDGYLANAAEPWPIPDTERLDPVCTNQVDESRYGEGPAAVFQRNSESLGRPWVTPGMPGFLHRIGGLEKDLRTGHISYDPANHQAMTRLRADKVAAVQKFIPEQDIALGVPAGDIAVVGWGSTYGAIYQAVRRLNRGGARVSHVHIRYLNPFPANLGELLAGFARVIVPEMNMGQLATLLRDKFGIDPVQLNKITGQPFRVSELEAFIREQLDQMLPATQRDSA